MSSLTNEISIWTNYFSQLLDNNFEFYAKGGTILGLQILKLLLNKYDQKEIITHIKDLYNLNLIQDWDFVLYTKDYDLVEQIARKHGIHNEGSTIKVLRVKENKIELNGEALFEMSIKEQEKLSDLELPMTSMKILVTKDNLNKIFSLALNFLNNEPDIEKIRNIMFDIDIIIPDYDNGFFKVNIIDKGGISNEILKIIEKDNSLEEQQFIISHFIQPDRMFSRLLGKNNSKSEKISQFLNNKYINHPNWLLNSTEINRLVNKFVIDLKENIQRIYNHYDGKLYQYYKLFIKKDNLRKIISKDNISTFKDLINQGYNINDLNEIFGKIDLTSKITKGTIKKVNRSHNRIRIDYVLTFSNFLKEIEQLLKNVNIGRLVGLLNSFSDKSKQLLRVAFLPDFGEHVNKMNVLNNKSLNNKFRLIVPLIRTLNNLI